MRDGQRVRVWLDGRPEIDATVPAASGPGPEELFIGGRSDGADGWEGRIDEVALFDRPLSAEEIGTIFGPPPAP